MTTAIYDDYIGEHVHIKFIEGDVIHIAFQDTTREAIQEWSQQVVMMLNDDAFDPLRYNRLLHDFCPSGSMPSVTLFLAETRKLFSHPRIPDRQFSASVLDLSHPMSKLIARLTIFNGGRRRFRVFNCSEFEQALAWLREQE